MDSLTRQPLVRAALGVPAFASPLGEADYAAVRAAAAARRAIAKAARIATASATFTLFLAAAAAVLLVGWFSIVGLLVTAALAVVGVVEWTGGRRMRVADRSAPTLLAVNQLALLGAIICYCAFRLATFSPQQMMGGVSAADLQTALGVSLQQVEQLLPAAVYGFYGLVISGSVLMQGGMALYYFTRRRHVQAYLSSTPPWVQRLFAEVAAGA